MSNTDGTGQDNLGWVGGALQEVTETLFDLMRSNPFYLNDKTEPYSEPGFGLMQPQVDEGWLHVQNILNPFVLFLATLGILLAALRLLWQRRLDPMMDLIRGLLTVIVTTFAGIFIVTVLISFSRALTDMVLNFNSDPDSVDEDLLDRAAQVYPSVLRTAMNEEAESVGFAGDIAQGAITEMVGLAVIAGLTVQIVVMALLQAIIYLIVCVLPLAAASTMVPSLKIFTKLVGWLFACLLYKPLVLLIYLAGLVLLGINTGDQALFRYLLAAAVMLLSTGALPVLMKLMSSPGVWALAAGSAFIGGGGSGGGSGGSGASSAGEGTAQESSNNGQESSTTTASAQSNEGALSEAANSRASGVEDALGSSDFPPGGGNVQTADMSGEGLALAASSDGSPLGGSGSLAGGGGGSTGAVLTNAGGGGPGSVPGDPGTVAAGSDESAVSGYVSGFSSETSFPEGEAASGASETGGEFMAAPADGGGDLGALSDNGGGGPAESGAPPPSSPQSDNWPSGAREA